MPLVDTRQFKKHPHKRKKKFKPARIIAVIILVLTGYFLWSWQSEKPGESSTNNTTTETNQTSPESKEPTLKTFSGEDFKELARGISYPNTQLFEQPPEITGSKEADIHIRKLAESRGFELTSIPVAAINRIDEPRLDVMGDDLLQPLATQSWIDLKSTAEKQKIPLSLLSGYRSPEYQRRLFMSRLGANVDDIIAKKADSKIIKTLLLTAPPGYSRHHTGYTIDLWCEDGSATFLTSSCYKWISANNYKVAKEHGWIPSYPDGVKLQGPEPEPWEYVWVDKQLLYN